MVLLKNDLLFPPVSMADEEGVLAIGGDLSTERLLLAYRSGIFPWYSEGEPIVWWSPDPRFVLFPEKIRVTKSMQTVLNNGKFRFTTNRAFSTVIQNCKTSPRKEQEGTWTGLKKTIIGIATTLVTAGGVWLSTLLGGGDKTEPAAQQAAPVINITNSNQQQQAAGKTVIIQGGSNGSAAAKPAEKPKPKKEGDEFKEKPAAW